MKVSLTVALFGSLACVSHGFTSMQPAARSSSVVMRMSTEAPMAESGVPPVTSDSSNTEDVEIPTNLPSECGMDYIPLATMLATGQLAEADQVC